MVAANKAGLSSGFSADTVWLLNREAIARKYQTTPVIVENWPQYERDVALKWMAIEAEAEKKRPKSRK